MLQTLPYLATTDVRALTAGEQPMTRFPPAIRQWNRSAASAAHLIQNPVRQNSRTPRTQTKTGHEHRKYDGNKGRGHAEAGHCESDPNHLINQAAKSGDHKKTEVPAQIGSHIILIGRGIQLFRMVVSRRGFRSPAYFFCHLRRCTSQARREQSIRKTGT
jgi:hypothetical protein